MGAGESADAACSGESRISFTGSDVLLQLLWRCGGRSEDGLLQLRTGNVAHCGFEQRVRSDWRLQRGIGAGKVVARGFSGASHGLHAGVFSQTTVQLGRKAWG